MGEEHVFLLIKCKENIPSVSKETLNQHFAFLVFTYDKLFGMV